MTATRSKTEPQGEIPIKAETTMDDDQRDVKRSPVMITSVLGCVGALSTGSLEGNLYLYDTNRRRGSAGLGSQQLNTRVREGDQLLWTVMSLECEAHVAIDAVLLDPSICVPQRQIFGDSGVAYWLGTVLRPVVGIVPYRISFIVGNRLSAMTTGSAGPALLGGGAQ